jgi:hypothetical protein
MNHLRLAITTVLVLLALGAAASSAVGATSRLVPSVPWLPAAPPSRPAAPVGPTHPASTSGALPNTGFPIWSELLFSGIMLCSGTAIRARTRRGGGVVRLAPALAGRR